ncbi:MAG: ornithine cyclodeaminase family protein [bacterium]|nr:ornithine cyclodeaminase family protein [bacterium]
MTKLISRSDVIRIATMDKTVPIVESAFAHMAKGDVLMPPKIYLDLPDFSGDFRAMPAYYKPKKKAGIKWVNSHTNNPKIGKPAVSAILILNDPETADTLAIIDAGALTGIRTGAAGGVASKYCARAESKTALYVGCGMQAYYQILAQQIAMPMEKIVLYDLNSESATKMAHQLATEINAEVSVIDNLETGCKSADIITTTTPGRAHILKSEWVMPGTHINAIGADAEGKQELPSALTKKCRIIVDEWEQASHSGEINVPIHEKIIEKSDIAGTIGQCVIGDIQGRNNDDEITLFDSTGLAIQDLALAAYIYEQCESASQFNFNG